uniref:Uncharacterized protein n=1 Tax=Anguilla anguilla TaxID=7936 RepID=A0A0E9WUB9_ANGAN
MIYLLPFKMKCTTPMNVINILPPVISLAFSLWKCLYSSFTVNNDVLWQCVLHGIPLLSGFLR